MKAMLLVFALCLGLVAVGSAEVVREETVTVYVSSGDPVEISNINGDITIEEWDSDEVEVSYTICSDTNEELDAVSVECDTENGILCIVEYDEQWDDSYSADVDFSVKVPAGTELEYEIEFVNGDLYMVGGSGSAEFELVNGDMGVEEYDGELYIVLVNGDVDVTGSSGIRLVEVVNGSIYCSLDDIDDELEMASVSGDIILDLNTEALVEISTISGDIEISETFNAMISEDIVGCTAEFGDGEYEIEISTISGDITVND